MEKKCVYCGCKEELFLTTDHKNPKCRGGRNTPDNVQWACWLCNIFKGGLTHKEFLREIKKGLEPHLWAYKDIDKELKDINQALEVLK